MGLLTQVVEADNNWKFLQPQLSDLGFYQQHHHILFGYLSKITTFYIFFSFIFSDFSMLHFSLQNNWNIHRILCFCVTLWTLLNLTLMPLKELSIISSLRCILDSIAHIYTLLVLFCDWLYTLFSKRFSSSCKFQTFK